MPAYGESFLSKVLDDGNTMAIREFAIERDDFPTETERQAFDFIMDYAKHNGNKTPDFRTVIEKVPEFYYREGVTDSYRYLAKELKSFAAKRKVAELFNGKGELPSVEELINSKDGNDAISDLISELERIKIGTSVREKVGTNLKLDSDKIRKEYERRKSGESYRVWNS